MFNSKIFFLFIGCIAFLISCTSDEKASKNSTKAYQDYKSFVAEVEQDTALSEKELGTPWTARTDSMRTAFDKHKSEIAAHIDEYEPERREEINAFEDRLEVAFDARQKKYDEVSYRYKFRQEMLGLVVSEDDLSSIAAADLAKTYEHFVTTLQRDMTNFTQGDWQLIEGWWNALENRKKEIGGKLSATDKESITNHQNAYMLLHEQAVIDAKATPVATPEK